MNTYTRDPHSEFNLPNVRDTSMNKEWQRIQMITDHKRITRQLMAEEEYKVERDVYSLHRT